MTSSRGPGARDAGHLDAAALRTLGRETGAGTVVSGAYYRQGDSVRFQVQISAAKDGTVLRALEPVAGPISQPLAAVEAVRQRVMAALAILFDSRLSFWAKSAGQPPSFPSYQEFIQGLDRMVRSDPHGAIDHFRRAALEDTTFRLPLIFAAHEYLDLDEFATADSVAQAVERAPGRLAPLDQRHLTWVLAEARGDRQRALETAREMAAMAPNSETLWLVAQGALALNRPREMLAGLTTLGPDRGLFRGWWVYWFYLSFSHHLLGDYRRELKEALEGRRRHPAELTVLAAEVRALAALGRAADITERLVEAPSLPAQPGWSPADIALLAALELAAHDHRADAAAPGMWAVRWLESRLSAEARSGAHRFRLALAYYVTGRPGDTRAPRPRWGGGPTLGGTGGGGGSPPPRRSWRCATTRRFGSCSRRRSKPAGRGRSVGAGWNCVLKLGPLGGVEGDSSEGSVLARCPVLRQRATLRPANRDRPAPRPPSRHRRGAAGPQPHHPAPPR